MDLSEIINSLKTDKLLNVLKKIIGSNREIVGTGDETLITIKAVLVEGYAVNGRPIDIDENFNTILLAENNDFIYFNSKELIAMEVFNSNKALEILSDGRYFNIEANKIPGNLELKKTYMATQKKIDQSYGIVLKTTFLEKKLETSKIKYQFNRFLEILENSLSVIARDSIGQESLQKIKELHVEPTDKDLHILGESFQLTFYVNFNTNFTSDFEQHLTSLIEQKL